MLGAAIARLDQFHGLIAVLRAPRWWRAGENGIHEAHVCLTIAPLVRDAQLPVVVLHNGLAKTSRIRDLLHLLSDELRVFAVEFDALEGKGPGGVRARREGTAA